MQLKTTLLPFVLAITTSTPAAFASEDKGANFGGPDAVDNQIAEDNKKSQPDFKAQLQQNNISMGLDYSAAFLGATNTLAGSDDTAGSGMVRFLR